MKINYILLALIPLCMAGCSEKESIGSVEPQREVRVTAGADAQSRIVLKDLGSKIRTIWQNGDNISLFTSTQSNLVYSTTIEENVTLATFTPVDTSLENVEGNTVYACYPNATLASEEGMIVNLPATEILDYKDGTIGSFGYSVGTISDGCVNFNFKHISAFLGVTVTPDSLSDATKAISSVKVTSTATEPLSVGKGDTFDFSTQTAITTHGTNTVQINVDNLLVEDSWTVYVPLLPQPAGATITITMADSEGTTLYTVTKPTPSNGFQAGRVYKQGVYDKAYLIDGPTFIKRINEFVNYAKVGSVEFLTNVQTLPESFVEVSTKDSPVPIYASFNVTDSLLTISTCARNIEVVDASYMFSGFMNLRKIDFGNFQINETTTNLENMFNSCHSLLSLDVSSWDTGNVTDMDGMFFNCSGLTSLDVSGWDTGNVTNMLSMFRYCSGLTSLDVSGWDTGNVTNMYFMFSDCSGLTSLDVSGWDTSNVTIMHYMFSGCSGLISLNLTGWDTGNVTNMDYMFSSCSGLTSLDVSGWDTSNVTSMFGMFSNCSGLTSLDVSSWDTSNVTNMGSMFTNCSGLTSLDVSSWDTSNVIKMGYMFYNCSGLTSLNVSNWNTNNVTNISNMFSGCSGLTVLDLSTWNVENVIYTDYLFDHCINLTQLDISNWHLSNSPILDYMFWDCASTSQACKITTSTETQTFLLGKTGKTRMKTAWFTWEKAANDN